MDLNKVSLIGNLGKDPDIKTFTNGGSVANFSVATTRKWKDKEGEQQEKTEWTNISVRDKNLVTVAEKYLQKGTRVYLEGRLETRTYEKDGETRYITECVLAPFEGRLHIEARGKGWKDDGESWKDGPGSRDSGSGGGDSGYPDDDEIPF